MPYLTLPLSDFGPITEVLIGVTNAKRSLLEKHNMPVPARVSARGLIDTGASLSLVDPKIPQQLGLSPTGKVSIKTVSTGHETHDCNEFDVSITLLNREDEIELLFPYTPVAESTFHPAEGCEVIIGRNILQDCLFIYDGRARTFSFAY